MDSLDDFTQKLKAAPRPVVVDFWAPWCLPCRAVNPLLKKLEQKYSEQVDVWKVNADEHGALLQALNIYGIPTLLVFRDGQEVSRAVGAQPYPALEKLFLIGLGAPPPVKTGPDTRARLWRVWTGLLLLLVAFAFHSTWITLAFAALAGLVIFSAVYDRCPVWQAISRRVNATLRRSEKDSRQVS